VFEGHPFIVEAGVSIGGRNAKEGITVYRFANRIPLLFEVGNDVVAQTAMKRIKYVLPAVAPF
jgi:DNA topoisomerase-6 subunit B